MAVIAEDVFVLYRLENIKEMVIGTAASIQHTRMTLSLSRVEAAPKEWSNQQVAVTIL